MRKEGNKTKDKYKEKKYKEKKGEQGMWRSLLETEEADKSTDV